MEDDQKPLVMLGTDHEFQPNPFWGSRSRKAKHGEI